MKKEGKILTEWLARNRKTSAGFARELDITKQWVYEQEEKEILSASFVEKYKAKGYDILGEEKERGEKGEISKLTYELMAQKDAQIETLKATIAVYQQKETFFTERFNNLQFQIKNIENTVTGHGEIMARVQNTVKSQGETIGKLQKSVKINH